MSRPRGTPPAAAEPPAAVRLVLTALAAGAGARVLYDAARRHPPGGPQRWRRTNHRGEPVTLLAGPALAGAATAAAALAPGLPPGLRASAVGAVATAGVAGAYDDLRGSGDDKGLRGHLRAAREGRVTSGLVKIVAIGLSGLAAGALLRRGTTERLLAGVVVAGSANLVNLLDLRPGRAGKACVAVAGPGVALRAVSGRSHPADTVAAGALGAALGLLPEDLAERAMLGDAGANALGAALGVAAAARASKRGLALRAAALVGLTLASERISFTRVVEAVPPLRALDQWGRRPADTTST